jgi:hypothetical protein
MMAQKVASLKARSVKVVTVMVARLSRTGRCTCLLWTTIGQCVALSIEVNYFALVFCLRWKILGIGR